MVKETLELAKISAKKIEWGFDLSGFNTESELNKFMIKHKCKTDGSKEIIVKGKPKSKFADYKMKHKYYFWKCPGFAFTTGHSGKASDHSPGFLGYVGAEIKPDALVKWKAFRNDFVEKADVKDESKHKNDFISPPSVMRKRPKIDWI